MRRKPKTLLILTVITLGLILAAWLATSKIASNNAYKTLEKSVQGQAFSSLLDNPQKGTTECYPPGAMQDACLSLSYTISDADCLHIAKALGEAKCKTLQRHNTYQEKDIAYTISIWNNGTKKLVVYLNESSRLY